MATRRQREAAAAAPRPAANAVLARSGLRNQTVAAAAARSGPRNRTAATPVAVAAPPGPRNTRAAAAAAPTCRPHARNRRPLGEIGNQVNIPAADREANRCRLSSRPNVAAVPHARARPAAAEGANASRTEATADYLIKRFALAVEMLEITESHVEELKELNDCYDKLNDNYDKLSEDYHRYVLNTAEVMQTNSKLQAMVDKKESELQKVVELNSKLQAMVDKKESELQKVVELNSKLQAMVGKNESELQKVVELNVKLLCVVDKKEAQLQALSEQCKILALNSN